MEDEKGAITVFLILITTVVFCFSGLMIDGIRIMLADEAVDEAATSALRSTMGHYNQTLVSEYGLYAIQDTNSMKVSDVYKKYLTVNLIGKSTNISKEGYTPINLVSFDENDIVECDVTLGDPLIRSDVFKHQIDEYMKIRGPVSAVMYVLQQLSDAFGKKADEALENANKAKTEKEAGEQTKENVTTFNKKRDAFNSKLGNELTPQKTTKVDWFKEFDTTIDGEDNPFASVGKTVSDNIAKEIKNIESMVLKSTSKSIVDVIWATTSEFADLSYNLNTELDEVKDSLLNAKNAANDYAGEVTETVTKIDVDGTDVSKYINTDYTNPRDVVTELSQSEVEVNNIISDLKNKINEYEEKCIQEKIVDSICKLSLLKQLGSSDGFEYSDESFISDYDAIVAKSNNTTFKNSLPSAREAMSLSPDRIEAMRASAINEVNAAIDAISEVSLSEIDEVVLPSESDEAQVEKDKNKTSALEEIDKLKTKVGKIQDKERNASQARGLFSSIKPYVISDSVYDEMETDTDSVNLVYISKLASFMKALTEDTALTSYVLDKCTYLTSAAGRDHYFQYGEVEYIFFGMDNQFANIATGIGAIFVLKVGIDSLYYFVNSQIAPLLARGIYAIVRGLIQGALDMVNLLVTDEGCALYPNSSIKAKYDELYFVAVLFKSFIGGYDSVAEPLKNTMQATLQYKDQLNGNKAEGIDITKMYTTVDAKVQVKVDLVFLPLMGFGLVDNDYFSDGCFKITKTAIATY